MTENFISRIFVEKVRNIENLEIELSKTSRQHLIITGKNGSGKTSLLLEINKYLGALETNDFHRRSNYRKDFEGYKKQINNPNIQESEKELLDKNIKHYEKLFEKIGNAIIEFSENENIVIKKVQSGNFILAYFDAKRQTYLAVPQGISKVELKKKYGSSEKANINFIQYIVNLKADRSFARDDNKMDIVEKIDQWFSRFENRLKAIFNVDDLELRFDRKTYNFDIIINKNQIFDFTTLSDGYSAILSIVTELLLRMEAHEAKSYDIEGVVIIDEIETHLHVDLQKKILPFLTDFFPKIQFIVSTHSPFVLSSLSNATICDLETRIITNDLSAYSYDALVESYFETDKYSEELKQKITEFENLVAKKERNLDEMEKLRFLRNYFAHIPKYHSTELLVKLQQIQLKELNSKIK